MNDKTVQAAGESLQGLAPATSRVLTMDTLRGLDACIEQRAEFRILWGESVNVTPEEMVKAAKIFDWGWACTTILSESGWLASRGKMNDFLRERSKDIYAKESAWEKAPYAPHDPVVHAEYLRLGGIVDAARNEWRDKESILEARIFAENYLAFPGNPRGSMHTFDRVREQKMEEETAEEYIADRKAAQEAKEKEDGAKRIADADADPAAAASPAADGPEAVAGGEVVPSGYYRTGGDGDPAVPAEGTAQSSEGGGEEV